MDTYRQLSCLFCTVFFILLQKRTRGGQDSVLRRVLRVGLTVGQCPVLVLYLSYTRPILVLHLSYDPNFKIELAKGMAPALDLGTVLYDCDFAGQLSCQTVP